MSPRSSVNFNRPHVDSSIPTPRPSQVIPLGLEDLLSSLVSRSEDRIFSFVDLGLTIRYFLDFMDLVHHYRGDGEQGPVRLVGDI